MDKTTLAAKGIRLFGANARFLPSQKERMAIAMDAAIPMVTAANLGIPEMFSTFVDPQCIEILSAPTNASKIFPHRKNADWKDTESIYTEIEAVGRSEAYSDYGKAATSDVNMNFPARGVHRLQTLIRVGDLEQERAAAVKIDLLSKKQQAAARVLRQDTNEIELFGYNGLTIYGMLNDPNIPAALNPGVEGGETAWDSKSAVGIYNDILSLFGELAKNSGGYIKFDTPMVLVVPPAVSSRLARVTELGVAPVMDMVKGYFPNLRVETLAQLEDDTGVQKVMLVAENVEGMPSGVTGYADLLRTSRVVSEYTSMSQKWMSSTTGTFIYLPFAVATMSGIQSA
jgi:hypothetical protein